MVSRPSGLSFGCRLCSCSRRLTRSVDQLELHHLDLAVLVGLQEGDLASDADVGTGTACDAGAEGLVGVPDDAVEFDVPAGEPHGALAGDRAVVAARDDKLDRIARADLLTGRVVQDRHPYTEKQVPGTDALLSGVDELLVTALPREGEHHR